MAKIYRLGIFRLIENFSQTTAGPKKALLFLFMPYIVIDRFLPKMENSAIISLIYLLMKNADSLFDSAGYNSDISDKFLSPIGDGKTPLKEALKGILDSFKSILNGPKNSPKIAAINT